MTYKQRQRAIKAYTMELNKIHPLTKARKMAITKVDYQCQVERLNPTIPPRVATHIGC